MSYKGKKFSKIYEAAEGYDLYADHYEEDYRYLRSFEEDILFKFCGDLKGKKVLDLGAGTGRLIGEFKLLGAKMTALDISQKMIEKINKRYPDVKTIIADAENLPIKDDFFDMVLATFLIVHLGDLKGTFDEVYRVLKVGGTFILSNINQRRAPKLKLKDGREIVIKSYYHRPEDVIKSLKETFFAIEKEEFVRENNVWINQVIKARK